VQKPHRVRIRTIQFVQQLYEFVCMNSNKNKRKNCIHVGISTRDQYRTCNRRSVCHPVPHLPRQWPFYLYTVQLRKPSEKWDCTNSFVWHIVNPILNFRLFMDFHRQPRPPSFWNALAPLHQNPGGISMTDFSKPDIEIPGGREKRTKNFGEGGKDGWCSPTDLQS